KMPVGYRTVFNLYAIDEYSHSEIAEILNVSRNTSKSQLLKARKYIINELNQKKSYGT
ncbi:MAG: RNA polymerase subunit sigma-24, partial [Bacteroidetes bacterium]|nr:RNA polymerase subunit sigma-24 [Bacteroidota bacterium]